MEPKVQVILNAGFVCKSGFDLDEWSNFREEFIGEKTIVESVAMRMLKNTAEAELDGNASPGTRAIVAPLLCSQLMQKSKSEDGVSSSDEILKQCASELLDHIVADHETFAITLTCVVYRLSFDPTMQSRLGSELLTLNPTVSIETISKGLPPPDSIDHLPLLNAILLETLRLHGPTPGRLPRVAPAAGMKLHDYYIPEGTTVSCNAYSLHRKEDIFPRPFEWLPQRWLSDKDRLALEADFPSPEVIRRYMWAFGRGGRMCIGSNFATQVIKLIIAAMYTSFTSTIVDDEGIEQADTLIAFPKGNKLIVRFEGVTE